MSARRYDYSQVNWGDSNYSIAKQLGATVTSVYLMRKSLGIPPSRKPGQTKNQIKKRIDEIEFFDNPYL